MAKMTEKDPRFRTYAIVMIGLVALASAVLFVGTAYFDSDKVLSRKVATLSSEDYLANLRESTEFGCRTFLDRRADILFVGDSHSYAGFDFDSMATRLGTDSISACVLGGFYLESFPLIVEAMRRRDYFPKVIVLGASPRQFVEGRDKADALAVHKFYLEHRYTLRDFVQDVAEGRLGRATVALDKSYAGQIASLADLQEHLTGLTEADAVRYIELNPNKAYRDWMAWTAFAKFTPDVSTKIDAMCRLVAANHALLYVVDIPESPFLRSRIYSDAVRQGYASVLARFAGCATTVISEPADYYGLTDRDFFDRSLNENFDVTRIERGEKLPPGAPEADTDYDLDHMNLIGAERFTAGVAAFLASSAIPR